MKKCAVLLSVLMIALLGLTGCESTLKEGMEAIEEANRVDELDLSRVFSETEGYHAPGIRWGMTLKEIPVIQDYTINSIVSYGTNGEISYKAPGLRNLFLGRENDDATVTVNGDEVGYMISYMFSADALKDHPELKKQSELSAEYLQKLIDTFGEPDDRTEQKDTVQGLNAVYTTYYWNYVTADGKETQMQWAEAFVSGAKEPNFVTLGFIWTNSTGDAE